MKRLSAIFMLTITLLLSACSPEASREEPTVSPDAPSPLVSVKPSAEPTATPTESPTPQPPSFAEGWFIPYNPDLFNLSVSDADGNDITERVIELWHGVNSIYCEESEDVFQLGEALKSRPVFYEILNYDEVIDEFFTDAGAEQFESDCDATHHIETVDGKHLRIGTWRTGWSCEYSIPSAEVVEVTDNRITLSVGYYDPNSCMGDEDPTDEDLRHVDFAIAKEDGVWKVDNYSYMYLGARCDDDECECHHPKD